MGRLHISCGWKAASTNKETTNDALLHRETVAVIIADDFVLLNYFFLDFHCFPISSAALAAYNVEYQIRYDTTWTVWNNRIISESCDIKLIIAADLAA